MYFVGVSGGKCTTVHFYFGVMPSYAHNVDIRCRTETYGQIAVCIVLERPELPNHCGVQIIPTANIKVGSIDRAEILSSFCAECRVVTPKVWILIFFKVAREFTRVLVLHH